MDESETKIPEKQGKKQEKYSKEFLDHIWKKGQSGNPEGRPKGKTMKEFAKDFFMNMSDEDKIEFLSFIDPNDTWKMAEGLPKQHTELSGDALLPFTIKIIKDGENKGEGSKILSETI